MKHKFVFLAILVSLISVPISIKADNYRYNYDLLINGLYYSVIGRNLMVTYPLRPSNTHSGRFADEYPRPSGNIIIVPYDIIDGDYYYVTRIGNEAFADCFGITSVTIPNTVIWIGDAAFWKCTRLTSVTIPNSVIWIGDGAFSGCTSLNSVIIPNSVTSIGDYAFSNCSSLTSVTIPDSVTSIGAGVFGSCSRLTSVTIPNSVTRIGSVAFLGCTSLTSVTIPNSVINIGDSAFYSCTGLTSINIPNSVTSIGNDAFYGCTSLTAITIPNSVTSIGSEAFKGCTSLTAITIPNSVTSIGEYAFAGCSGLTSINIPNFMTVIGPHAFAGCNGLTAINIPNSVTSIGYGAFSDCTNLTSVTIPNSVTSIGNAAFNYCSSLTSVTIPNSVTSIGNAAFKYCRSLTSVTIPNSVTSIGNAAFYNCTNLRSVTIPNSVTSIGNAAFNYCCSLTSVTIPNSVTSIGDSVFCKCTRLTSVTIPNSVTTIGKAAFYNCMELTRIICLADVPPYCDVRAFENVISTIPVYVPCGSKSLYQSRWSYFSNFIELSPYTLNVLSVDEAKGSVNIITMPDCDNNIAVVEATANYGYHFTQWNDGDISTSRTILLTQDTTFTAYFAPNQYTLTVTAGEHGTVSGSSGTYNYGDTITIQAYPEMNYRFTRWSDGVTTNPRTIVVSGNNSLTAKFALLTFFINANSNNDTMGSVTGSGYYAINSEVTLQARPNSGYAFERWSDGVTTNPRTIIASADTILTAIFEAAVIVTANSNNDLMGSVIGGGQYLRNTEVTLQATPNRGYHFVGWSDGENTNPRTLIVISDTTFTAIFEADIFTITANSTDPLMGSVTGSGNYPTNTTVTLQAVPNRGYRFVRWSDGILTNPRTLTVNVDTTLTAYFEAITITVTAISNNDMMGSVIGGGWYEAHTELILQAIPNSGYRFVRWNDDITTNPRTLIAYSDTSFTAYFAPDENAGIDGIETLNAMIYTSNGEIVVDGAEKNTVWLYDANGRLLSTKQNDYSLLRFNVPTSGTYFVKIGKHPAQKVIVIK